MLNKNRRSILFFYFLRRLQPHPPPLWPPRMVSFMEFTTVWVLSTSVTTPKTRQITRINTNSNNDIVGPLETFMERMEGKAGLLSKNMLNCDCYITCINNSLLPSFLSSFLPFFLREQRVCSQKTMRMKYRHKNQME